MKRIILTLIFSTSVIGTSIAEDTINSSSTSDASNLFDETPLELGPVTGHPFHPPLPAGTMGSIESPFTINASKIESLEDIEDFVKKTILEEQPKSSYDGMTYLYKDDKTLALGYFLLDDKVGRVYFDVTSSFKKLKNKDDKYNNIITTFEKIMEKCRNPKITFTDPNETDH